MPDPTFVSYRLATPGDVETLTALRAAFAAEVSHADPTDPALLTALHSYFSIAVPAGQFHAYLAEAGGQVVACSGLVFDQRPPSARNLTGREAYIMNMYTLPAWRGRGIATELLRRLLDLARQHGCRRASLHALPPGRSIYVKAGFTPVDKEMRLDL
jgi:GNAT superfamily N-acetyltransferase